MALVLRKYSLFHLNAPLDTSILQLAKKKLKVPSTQYKIGKKLRLIDEEFAIVS